MKDKDNYREVECCGNCKKSLTDKKKNKKLCPYRFKEHVCDKWEHE